MTGQVKIAGNSSVSSKRPDRVLTDCRVVCAQGNTITLTTGQQMVDWSAGLCGPLYGYAPDWWRGALHQAIDNGPTASLGHRLEPVVADQLARFYPDIEAVRFMVTGSDPCAAAVKIARAVTGRDNLLVYGYHGTASAYCTPPEVHIRAGLPHREMRWGTLAAERAAFIPLDWLGAIPPLDEVAAVVVECPTIDGGHAQAARWLQHLALGAWFAGTLFVLDEVITGFRYGPNGAAGHYGLTGLVDLYCIGKTLGNAYPVSALMGRVKLLQELTQGVHFSGTFFAEPLGLAAAHATLCQLDSNPPWAHLLTTGRYLMDRWNALGVPWVMDGHPTRPVVRGITPEFTDLRRHLFTRGHFIVDSPWFITTATRHADIDDLIGEVEAWQYDSGR